MDDPTGVDAVRVRVVMGSHAVRSGVGVAETIGHVHVCGLTQVGLVFCE